MRAPTIIACVALAAASAAGAQQGVVHGVVHDTTGAPIPHASVTIVPDIRTRADSTGRFALRGVKPGFREIRVRRIGYTPFDATLEFKADGSDTVDAELEPSPRKLPTVVTRAERQCHRFKYEGVWCRKADSRGLVFTVEEIDELQPEFLADLVDGTKGLRVEFGLSNFGQTRFPRPIGRCVVQLLNGLPPLGGGWTPWARGAMPDIAGFEVYAPNETPPEYRFEARRGEPCWLFNVWTWDKLKTS
jgi:hypothetical protein